MNIKTIALIFNSLYLIATIIWEIIENSVESFVAITGGFVSVFTFFVANDNSFSVTNNENKGQKIDNKKAKMDDK